MWDLQFHEKEKSAYVTPDLTSPEKKLFWWSGDQDMVLSYFFAYCSYWLPNRLLNEDFDSLVETLFQASKKSFFTLNFDKGLSGAPQEVMKREEHTSLNPIYRDSFALFITGALQSSKIPGLKGFEPNFKKGALEAKGSFEAYEMIKTLAPESGSYFSESNYFEKDWKRSCWGDHYDRLLEIKKKYDPDNLFRVHHGVGSDL